MEAWRDDTKIEILCTNIMFKANFHQKMLIVKGKGHSIKLSSQNWSVTFLVPTLQEYA